MKKLITIIAVGLISHISNLTSLYAQTLSPKATPSSGGYYNAGGNSLSWTLGETFNTTLSGGANMLTQGQQQPYIVTGGCTSAPLAPTVSGPNSVCGMPTAIYTAASTGAVSYTWGALPSGMTYFSGYNNHSNPMKVTIAAGTLTGNITATATNACGISTATTFAVTKKPGIPGAITATSLCGSTTGTFSITPTTNTVDYIWTMPGGLTITSTPTQTVNGTPHYGPSINVSKASTFIVGNISVSSYNACGNVPGPVKTVYGKVPVTPAAISGATGVCASSSGTYSTAGSTGGATYTWSIAGNATVTGAGLTAIVNFGSGFTTGTLKVLATNPCGTSSLRTLPLKAISCFASPIAVEDNPEEAKSITGFNLYPNPASNNFNLDITSDSDKDLTIELFDVLGNKVMSQQAKANSGNTTINISIGKLTTGLYLVRIIDEKNNMIYTERVVKE